METRSIALDASPLINLLGSGEPEALLEPLQGRCVIEERVVAEVIRHPIDGKPADDTLLALGEAGLLKVARMPDDAYETYLSLVGGSPIDALGAGESAALALASCLNMAVALDDGKGRRIAAARFAHCQQISSVGLMRLSAEASGMPAVRLAALVRAALTNSRMRVLPEERRWVSVLLSTSGALRGVRALDL